MRSAASCLVFFLLHQLAPHSAQAQFAMGRSSFENKIQTIEALRTGSTPDNAREPLKLQKELRLESDNFIGDTTRGKDWVTWQSILDVGTIDAGRQVELSLFVTSEREISFDSMESNCKCNALEISGKTFQPDSPQKITIRWKALTGNPEGKAGVHLKFVRNGIEFGNIIVSYRLAGSLYFQGSHSFVLRPGVSRFLIPISYTSPIKAEQLSIDWLKAEKSPAMPTRVTTSNGVTAIEILVSEKEIGEFWSGELIVKDVVVGVERRCSVAVSRQDVLTLSPRLVRFQRDSDHPKQLTSNIIFRVNQAPADSEDTGTFFPEAVNVNRFQASVGTVRLNAEIKLLGNGVYRVLLVSPADIPNKDSKGSIDLKIQTEDEKVIVQTVDFLIAT